MKTKSSISPKFYQYSRDGITQGLLAKFLSCREETKLFLDAWTPKGIGSPGLLFGNIMHSCLERYYNDIKTRRIKNEPDRAYVCKLVSSVEKLYMRHYNACDNATRQLLGLSFGIAEATLPSYIRKWWKADSAKIKWMGLEEQFKIPYSTKEGNKTFLRGKKDGVFSNPGLWLFETKTKSQINEGNLMDTLWFEHQVNFYLYAMKKIYGKEPKGVLYNIIRRTSLERKKTESLQAFVKRVAADVEKRKDFYFIRYEISLTSSELAIWEKQLEGMIEDFINWREGKLPHYRNTGQCIMKYGKCPMLAICSSGNYNFHQKRKEVFVELEGDL